MSYSTELKRQLAEREIKKNCCRRALLYGMLSLRGKCTEEGISLLLERESVAPLASLEISRVFGAVATARPYRTSNTRLSFVSPVAEAHIRSGALSYPERTPPCQACLSHFLRGVFLAGGRMADYRKLYRLEISAAHQADALSNLLTGLGLPPKRTERKGESILYYKTNSAICDLLAVIGAEVSAFELINDNIEAGYRGAANRRANCEARNIERSVEASMRFLQIFRALEAEDKLNRLPEELRETARLRAENPTLSLATLGSWCSPPVSKSGMNHRLEKIEALASELLAAGKEG